MTTNERIYRLVEMMNQQIRTIQIMKHELEVLKAGEPVTECQPCRPKAPPMTGTMGFQTPKE